MTLRHLVSLPRTQTLLQGGILPLPRVVNEAHTVLHSSLSRLYLPEDRVISPTLVMPYDASFIASLTLSPHVVMDQELHSRTEGDVTAAD